MKVYHIFDRPDPKESELIFNDESLTQQQFAEDCNINNIIDKYIKTGGYIEPFLLNNKEPVYGDITQVQDLAVSLQIINDAQEAFNTLPAKVREAFDNNPLALLEFVSNSENYDKAVALGLVEANLPVTPLDVTGTTDTTKKEV